MTDRQQVVTANAIEPREALELIKQQPRVIRLSSSTGVMYIGYIGHGTEVDEHYTINTALPLGLGRHDIIVDDRDALHLAIESANTASVVPVVDTPWGDSDE